MTTRATRGTRRSRRSGGARGSRGRRSTRATPAMTRYGDERRSATGFGRAREAAEHLDAFYSWRVREKGVSRGRTHAPRGGRRRRGWRGAWRIAWARRHRRDGLVNARPRPVRTTCCVRVVRCDFRKSEM